MAILIVDDESNTRETLREILSQMGHKTILEAKNGEEALTLLESNLQRVRMIISDWEMPQMDGLTLVQKIAEHRDWGLAPFLIVTSDLAEAKLHDFQKTCTRLDGHLIKPFRMNALAASLARAFAHRRLAQDLGLALGVDLPPGLKAVEGLYPRTWRLARTPAEADATLAVEGERLGSLLVLPPLGAELVEWLRHFRKSPRGAHLLTACASNDPRDLEGVRDQCTHFWRTPSDVQGWTSVLDGFGVAAQTGWDTELLVKKTRAALVQQKHGAAIKTAQQILELDPYHAGGASLLGDAFLHKGDSTKARQAYSRSLAINPCQPHAYIKLLELVPKGEPEREGLARAASAFCPHNEDVLAKAKL